MLQVLRLFYVIKSYVPPHRGTQAWQPGQGPLPAHIHAAQGRLLTQGEGASHHQHHQHAPGTPDPYSLTPQ